MVVDFSVPQHELLDDVLAIDAKRQAGGLTFSSVPKTRPDGPRRLTSNIVDSRMVDGYELGEERFQAMAEFAEQPTGTCAGTADMVPAAQASWFTELLAQAKAAPKVKLG
jgi:hypothetical protein